MFVGVCACPGGCLCVVRGGSSQTDNHRGGRTESERDECSVYWNKCKDRLQCQTGRACAPTCVCVLIVLSSDWLLFHTHVFEKVCFKHQFPLVTSEENWLFFKLSPPCNDFYWPTFYHKVLEMGTRVCKSTTCTALITTAIVLLLLWTLHVISLLPWRSLVGAGDAEHHHTFLLNFMNGSIHRLKSSKLCQWKMSLKLSSILFSNHWCSTEIGL